MYLVTFSKQASKDKSLIKNAELEKKAKKLLDILVSNPFQNPSPYEKLIGNLSLYYSRRISIQHRLVYRVDENTEQLKDNNGELFSGIVYVKRMWTHYD